MFYIASSIRIYILIAPFNNGLLTNNSTWCQNRGCICISSVRRNIWSNPHSCNNNSVDRIISKEEEREDPRRDSSIYLRVQNTVVFPQIIQELQDFFEYSVFYSVSTRNPATPSNSAYRINSSTRNTTTTRLIPCRSVQGIFQQLLPVLQALHTAGSSYKAPYNIPGPYSTSRLPVILGGRNSILHGSQHPRSPYSSSQVHSYKNSTRRNRILSKRVKYCISNTILRSVCSNLLVLVLE